MDHAGLHDRLGPDRFHRLGQAFQPVTDEHEDVADAAVLDLGEDVQPVLGALAAVAGPQPQDLPPALGGDRQGHVDRPVGDRAVTNLHVDGVNEDHRIDGAASSGRLCHSAMPSRTWSVMLEMVWRETSAP